MAPSWLAVASILAGGGTLSLVYYLWRYRGEPGATWFIAALSLQATYCFIYGASYFVFAPGLRWWLEVAGWLALAWMFPFFLAFGLEYNGRGYFVRSLGYAPIILIPFATTLVLLTNHLHGLFWQDFTVESVFGAASANYEFQAWAFFVAFYGVLCVGLATSLLFETVLSYGELYKKEALAVGFSTMPPGFAFLAWVLGVSPLDLNLTAAMFLPHVVLDAYAFVGSGMFRFNPATRRKAEDTAIDDLDNPVFVVNTEGNIINLNEAAKSTFGVRKEDVLGEELSHATGIQVDFEGDNELVEVRGEDGLRELLVEVSTLRDASSDVIGYTVLFQDVTRLRQQQQRLEVFRRAFRHNLRNDLNVVEGNIEIAGERVDDSDVLDPLATAGETVREVMDMAEKARRFEEAAGTTSSSGNVDLEQLLEDVADEVNGAGPEVVDVSVPGDVYVRGDPEILHQVFYNVVENSVEHNPSTTPRVEVKFKGYEDNPGNAVVEVSDNGSGIPEHELVVLREGEETPLEHGSGFGLWIINWGVRTQGGSVTYDSTPEGTTVTIQLPAGNLPE